MRRSGRSASSTTHHTGRSTVHESVDVYEQLLIAGSAGLTPRAAATVLFGDPAPDRNFIDRTRRRLETLRGEGTVDLRKDEAGASHYIAVETK